MDIELTIRWTKGIVICAVAAWEITQLTRRRDDLPLRVLVPGLVLLAIAATLGIKTPVTEPVQDLFGENWTHIVNGCWMGMAYCFAAYFLLANTDIPRATRKRKALIELNFLIACLIIMVVVKAIAVDGIQRPAESPERYHDWERTAWYLAVAGYGLIVYAVGVRRAMVLRRKLTNSWARSAFWLVIVGSAAMALGVDAVVLVRQGVRQFDESFDPDWLTSAYSVGQLSGQLVLALGLALVPLATVLVRLRARLVRRRRAHYRQRMMPLWSALTTEFPYVALDGGRTDFERVTTEITDGLSELARDCPSPSGDMRDPRTAAEVIATGLGRRAEQRDERWAGNGAEPEPPYPRLEPDFPDWRGRAKWMTAVADELRTRGVIEDHEHAGAS